MAKVKNGKKDKPIKKVTKQVSKKKNDLKAIESELNSLKDKSSRNIKLNQITNFDKKSLTDIISKNIPNVVIDKCTSFFLKPFTHDQMLKILETKIIDMNVIEALYLVSDDLPEYGAELYCLFSKYNI